MFQLENKEEIIRVQGKTLDIMQQELLSLKQAEFEVRKERDGMYQEIQLLKEKIFELEDGLKNSEEKAANLQMAVSLIFLMIGTIFRRVQVHFIVSHPYNSNFNITFCYFFQCLYFLQIKATDIFLLIYKSFNFF